MERNPESMQEFYNGREMQEISEIEVDMNDALDTLHTELNGIIDMMSEDE